MAKSIRSKVKKRLRTVKRGVVKRQMADPTSKIGAGIARQQQKLAEAATGYVKPERVVRNAFRYDDADAEVPQHNWRQGPDYRAMRVGAEAGFAAVGSNRPKLRHGGDAPTATVRLPPRPSEATSAAEAAAASQVARLHSGSEQYISRRASKRSRGNLKNKSGIDHNVFRWT